VAIPGPSELFPPFLAAHADGAEHQRAALREQLADAYGLSDEERQRPINASGQSVFGMALNTVAYQLTEAGLLEKRGYGVTRITERGRKVLDDGVQLSFGAVARIREHGEVTEPMVEDGEPAELSRAESLEATHSSLEATLANEILARLHAAPPEFFEQVVLDVLVAIGYGGSRAEAVQHLGKTGDGGVDGVIQEDPLGTELVYVQAKRYDPAGPAVGAPAIMNFLGALHARNVRRGVFMTTASFSAPAVQLAREQNIALVDGERLAGLMIKHGVGVVPRAQYTIKELDENYFTS
jgi:restriction system protein